MKQNRNVVRLSESQLKAMIAESVREVLNEIGDTTKGQFALGALDGRSYQRYLNHLYDYDKTKRENNKKLSSNARDKAREYWEQDNEAEMFNAYIDGLTFGKRRAERE